MRILVTGGNGFIGRRVSGELLAKGHEVLVLDRHSPPQPQAAVAYFGDVTDSVAVTEAAAHVDGIIHLAAVLGTAETIDNPRPAAVVNILGTLNVLEAATQYDLPVVYAAVGNHFTRTQGAGAYTITKSAAEDFCTMYRMHRGTKVNVVRPMNAYGPGQSVAAPFGWSKVRKITPAFVCRALSGIPIEVYGDGTQVSDMVFVADVARTFVHALEQAIAGAVFPFAIECGPAESQTVNEVADLIADLAASYSGLAKVDIVHLPMRRGEPEHAVVRADVSTLELAGVNWDFVTLENGMVETVRWFFQSEGITWHKPDEALREILLAPVTPMG